MSRKSVVKGICDIFESETDKCHTLKICGQGDSKDISDKERHGKCLLLYIDYRFVMCMLHSNIT